MRSGCLFFLVVLMVTSLGQAKPRYSKDWVLDIDGDDFLYASTLNSSRHILGQYCYLDSGNCMYLVDIGITCDKGYKTPALVNSNAGAVQVKLVCGHTYKKNNVLYIYPFDQIDTIVKQANYLSIAVPMENDRFKVSRFSLSGSTYAIELMRMAAERAMEPRPSKKERQDVEYL